MAKKKSDNWITIAEQSDLRDELEKLAKRANQRLREIENQGLADSSVAYKAVERRVYDKELGYVQTTYRSKKTGEIEHNIAFSRRFKGMSKKEMTELKHELVRFLEASTSTVSGYKGALERSYEGYMKGTGHANLSFEEYKAFWKSESVKTYGYTSIQRVMKSTGKQWEKVEKVMNMAIAEQANLKEKLKTKDLIARVNHPEYYDSNGNWRPPRKGRTTMKKKR